MKIRSYFTVMVLAVVFITLTGFMHPLHVSVTNIEYDSQKSNYQVSFKIFTDDFELAMGQKNNMNVKILGDDKNKNLDSLIMNYINAKFSVFFNNKKQTIKFSKIENNFEATWVHCFIENNKKPKLVKIENLILTEMFDDQNNLLFFKHENIEKAEMCNRKQNNVNWEL